MGKKISWDIIGYVFHHKDKIYYHRFLPLCFSVLILIKHDVEAQSLDKLLDWIHYHFLLLDLTLVQVK